MNISENAIVTVTYDLYVPTENGEDELMESATLEQPLTFCYGIGMMLPKFESGISGLKAGDNFDFTIKCTDAYGERIEEQVIELQKSIFEVDGKIDENQIFEGNTVPLMDSEGNRFNAAIMSVDDTTVTVDLNHPLAGEDLHFKGNVVEVRMATEEEINAYKTPHCGCGGDCHCEGDCDSHEEGCGCGCH